MNHPSEFIDSALIKLIRSYVKEAETLGQLHPSQLQIVYKQNWFNLFVPKQFGGLELNLLEGLQIQEALAFTDGSVGWTVTLCSGANMFIGFLPPSAANEMFVSSICLSGSGQPSGIAKIINDGYEISGNWKYATGILHAHFLTANCQLQQNGVYLKDENGKQITRSFWFKKEEVEIINNWKSMGLIATGSHTFCVRNLKVDKKRCFNLQGNFAVLPQPIYRFPFLQFAETTLAINLAGMCRNFIDASNQLAENRKKEKHSTTTKYFLIKIKRGSFKLEAARELFYKEVSDSYFRVVNDQTTNVNDLSRISMVSRKLANTSRQVVDTLFPYCGLYAADTQSDLNRIWRNFHTATQHSLLNYPA